MVTMTSEEDPGGVGVKIGHRCLVGGVLNGAAPLLCVVFIRIGDVYLRVDGGVDDRGWP